MTLKNDRYTYRVTWSDEDNEYICYSASPTIYDEHQKQP